MTTAAATTQPRNAGGPRRRFDRDQAFAYYADLGATRTFSAVAARFGVSGTTIKNVSRQLDWEGRIAELESKARTQTELRLVKSFADRQTDQILATQKLRSRVNDAELDDIDLSVAIRALPRYATLERLIAGEATARIALADLGPVFDTYNAVVLELADLARRADPEGADQQLERLDEALAGLAAQAARDEGAVVAALVAEGSEA